MLEGLPVASPKARVARARRSVPEDQVILKGELLSQISSTLVQVDTPGKKLLVGVAVGYLALVLVVPTLNVFAQVNCCCCVHPLLLQCL